MHDTHTERTPETRGHILDRALDLFAQQGIAGTTVAQIAHAAGVTSAMVHYYFTNRDGLLDALVTERLVPAFLRIWGDAETLDDPRRLISEAIDRLLELVERMPQLPALWSREIANVGGLLRSRIQPHIPVARFEELSRSIRAAQEAGRVRAGIAPELVLPSVLGVIMLPLAAREFPVALPSDLSVLRQHARALLLGGVYGTGAGEDS